MNTFTDIDPELSSVAFDCVDVGIFIHDEKKTILKINKAAEKIIGFSSKEAVGRDCRLFFSPEYCDKFCALCNSVGSEGPSRQFEAQITKKDGTRLWIRMNAFPFKRDGRDFFLVTLNDVTEIHRLEEQLSRTSSFCGIVGRSGAIQNVFSFIRSVSETDLSVLITGETGTGKEMAASAIQQCSLRKSEPFVKVNCAALPDSLIESELFGHVKGAFTNATEDRIGRFEAANGGTIFLDEIGEIPLNIQVKLLRVLQEREVERVGEHRPRKLDIRVITASNKDLLNEVGNGRFRQDLYYRISGATVVLPSLRERKEDIPLLTYELIARLNEKYSRKVAGVSAELMDKMMAYHWPGNVREMFNRIEQGVVLCKSSMLCVECVFSKTSLGESDFSKQQSGAKSTIGGSCTGKSEKKDIVAALETNRYKISAAAKSLGMSRTTLWRKMKYFRLNQKSSPGKTASFHLETVG